MEHEQIIARAGDYHAGRLGKAEKVTVEGHLRGCSDCRDLYGRWRLVEPPTGFLEGVMADLPQEAVLNPRDLWGRRLQLWGTLAAAVLVGVVFWRPERDWLNADRTFAWTVNGEKHHSAERFPGGRHD